VRRRLPRLSLVERRLQNPAKSDPMICHGHDTPPVARAEQASRCKVLGTGKQGCLVELRPNRHTGREEGIPPGEAFPGIRVARKAVIPAAF